MTKQYSLHQAQLDLPSRKRSDNKTRGGKCLIVAGSPGKWGAAILCATAAARCGAGYVYIFDPLTKFPVHRHPDFLILKQLKNISEFDSVAIGPGFDNPRVINSLIKKLRLNPKINVVLDAEAINFLATQKSKQNLPRHWIVTPHEGELSRLLNVSSSRIRSHRAKYARLAQNILGCIILLKGNKTLTVDSKLIWENLSGNPALAKAGTGDVLTGMIVAFLSQKIAPQNAASLAAFAHGFCADQWLESGNDILTLMASDLLQLLPKALKILRSKN